MSSSKENGPSNPTIFINFVLDIESQLKKACSIFLVSLDSLVCGQDHSIGEPETTRVTLAKKHSARKI